MNGWFCIAGREKELTVAEVWSRLLRDGQSPDIRRIEDVVIVDGPVPAPLPHLLASFGGVIKIGRILFRSSSRDLDKTLLGRLFDDSLLTLSERVVFGVSAAGMLPSDAAKRNKIIGMKIKKELAGAEYPSRLVSSDEVALSSVSVTKNKLIDLGGELYLIYDKDGSVYVGRTEAVQDFEAYGERDYERPGRSMRQGMLPPKVAQIMINLSAAPRDSTLLDPFCGAGTVLQEASLMGYTRLIASDIDRGAIQRTMANQRWIQEQYPDLKIDWRIEQIDARKLRTILQPRSIGAVVSEGDLGPLTPPRSAGAMRPILIKLQELYEAAIGEWGYLLQPGGRAVFAAPRWHLGSATQALSLEGAFQKAGMRRVDFPASLVSKPLQYARPGQRVSRDIHVYEKNSR